MRFRRLQERPRLEITHQKDPLKIQKIWGEPFIGTRSNVIVTQLFC